MQSALQQAIQAAGQWKRDFEDQNFRPDKQKNREFVRNTFIEPVKNFVQSFTKEPELISPLPPEATAGIKFNTGNAKVKPLKKAGPLNGGIRMKWGNRGGSTELVSPLASPTPTPTPMPTPSPTPTPIPLNKHVPQDLAPVIYQVAEQYGINPYELSNLLARESMGFNPRVMRGELNSPVGARGVAQFMPETAEWFGNTHYQPFDPLNPQEAIPAAGAYLDYIKRQYGFEDWRPVYAAYNAGPGQVNRVMREYGDFDTALKYLPRETQNYVPAVLGASTP